MTITPAAQSPQARQTPQTTCGPQKTYQTWSETETRQLIDDVREGTSYSAIAQKTGRSVRSITVKVAALRSAGHYLPARCPHTRWSAKEKASLLSMAAAGTSYQEMAQRLNRTVSQVNNQLFALRAEDQLSN